ncbi:G protein-activated inward rectifier potassium channel 3-like [Sardina pilchardus]|uniref:G protein-activated inward rectifier potassium channel 3-like n=1 Tax=Sardina pilchardus TaxID=27697 RepID=UPI002E0EFB76
MASQEPADQQDLSSLLIGQQSASAARIGQQCPSPALIGQQHPSPVLIGLQGASPDLIGHQHPSPALVGQRRRCPVLIRQQYSSPGFIGQRESSPALIGQQHGSPTRLDARRNSIPPAQALTAKHLLAYLPRPTPGKTRYTPYSKKVGMKAAAVAVAALNSHNIPVLSHRVSSLQPAIPSLPSTPALPSPPVVPAPLAPQTTQTAPPPTVQDAAAPDDLSKALRTLPGRHLKRFSSRWQASVLGSDRNAHRNAEQHNGPANPATSHVQRNQRCKLLGDESAVVVGTQRQRYVTKDGKCRVNLGPIEDKSRFLSDIFTTLVDLKYRWFLCVFTAAYLSTWLAFGLVYLLDAGLRGDVAHAGDPDWPACFENVDGFLSALLLSVESQRTIGYGSRQVSAHCWEGVLLIMVQSILGSIIDALMVGCMFVKISRPQQRAQTLIFSKRCVVSERDDKLCLLFRIGDLRESHMVDAKIRAKLIKSRQTKEGEFIPLEQSEINLGYDTGGDRLLLVEPQTITHVINESSPFWEVGGESLRRERFEIIVILEGIVEASGMTCQARTSYTEDEILWGHRFESCMLLEEGAFRVDYAAFNKTFDVHTSPSSAKAKSEEKEREVKGRLTTDESS